MRSACDLCGRVTTVYRRRGQWTCTACEPLPPDEGDAQLALGEDLETEYPPADRRWGQTDDIPF